MADSTPVETEPTYDAPLITPEEAAQRAAGGALVIDVRSDAGRARDGVIPGSVRGDRENLDAQFLIDSPEKLAEVTEWDQDIVIVCGSIRGSGPVAEQLRAKGFTNVAHVDGGFPAWKESGAPTAEV
ncbi:rhodanese-like domain-containing protein [Microbacterium aoyamense]|uniref:Rhodanese-like domain-containing protein n=1 Tax=Microbacterium aoyamense TaxID=344166 RepID=A0ABN2PTM3_9MICO|nr:rhodanese-like domain-containing protein [Microbacterium aoyamense]